MIGSPLLKSNASGVACLTLNKAKVEEGDAQNRLIELAADSYPGSDPHARQSLMLSLMFGWEDAAMPLHHNQEILDETPAKDGSWLNGKRDLTPDCNPASSYK